MTAYFWLDVAKVLAGFLALGGICLAYGVLVVSQ